MADSYTLREAAEILGLSRRSLQRRLEEGAFPGRFSAPGRGGLETRVPAQDIERELELRRKKGRLPWVQGSESTSSLESLRPNDDGPFETSAALGEVETLVPYEGPEVVETRASASSNTTALTQSDLESLRDAMLAIVREDREMFLSLVRDALVARDREVVGLRHDLAAMQRTMDLVRLGLEGIERKLVQKREEIDPVVWADILTLGPSPASVDVEEVLREIEELEVLLGRSKAG